MPRSLAILLLAITPRLLADGGAMQLRQEAGPFVVTVFATPEPLRAGPADISVLVQDRETLDPLLDANVAIRLQRGDSETTIIATREQAQNKLLYAAAVNLAEAGEWKYSVIVQRGAGRASVSGSLTSAPAEATLASHWGSLAFPPLCMVIFVLHQWLSRRQALEITNAGRNQHGTLQ